MSNRGFTLIELLVVIAIIGALSSVVLASLNVARGRGVDGLVKSNFHGVRAQSEIYYDTNGNYGADFNTALCNTAPVGTMFEDDQVAARQIDDSDTKSGSSSTCVAGNGLSVPDGTGVATSWAISIPLKSGSTWCVSSSGGGELGKTAQIFANTAVCQ